jgi:predicted 3-demethylubiquinone-9 3-methyltransferase (glyoxalase superfamily)
MQKISPFLWYDKEAGEAAKLYTSIFEDSSIQHRSVLHHTPSGDVEVVRINLMGYELTMMSAGPLFKFTPAISFFVGCKTPQKVDELWEKLSQGGSALMPLGPYPFSERYGWLEDRFGLSWQIMFMGDRELKQRVIPTLLYTGKQAGKTEEAIRYYTSIFKNSSPGTIMRYGKEDASEKEGTIKYASFTIAGQEFAAMDSAREHKFNFTEAISLEVHCDNQDEVDYFWKKLSADPNSEQCGWLKDQFGVSWQIIPTALHKMLADKDPAKVARVTQAFLPMKKLDIATLERAYNAK